MAKFRFHRGSFIESLSTEVNINSKEELIKAINKEFPNVTYNDIEIRYYCFDERISMNTFLVLDNEKNIIGMYYTY